jgi:glutaredoxin 3
MNSKTVASNSQNPSLDTIVANSKTVIVSLQGCPYCATAKKTLQKYTTDSVEVLYKPAAHREWILRHTGRTSLPAVFINKRYVGGCNDGGLGGVCTLDNKGLLKTLLCL